MNSVKPIYFLDKTIKFPCSPSTNNPYVNYISADVFTYHEDDILSLVIRCNIRS